MTEIADRNGVSPDTLSPPLSDVVDPDTLATVFDNRAASPPDEHFIQFSYLGHIVRVRSDESIQITEVDR